MTDVKKENIAMTESSEDYTLHPDTVEFLVQALAEEDSPRVRDLIKDLDSADLAEFINIIKTEQRQQLVSILDKDFDPEILVDLDPEIKDEVISLLGAEDSAAAITKLESDDAIQVIEDLEKEEQEEILEAVPEEQRQVLEEGLSYEEDSAGRLMNNKFVAIPSNWNVGKTIDHLRESGDLPEDFYSIFITDKDDKPIGSALVSRVIRNKRDVKIKDIIEPKLRTINVNMDQEEIAYIFQKYALASAPVIDEEGRIVGVILLDDIVDVIEEEAEEDIMRLGGVAGTDLYSAFMKTAMRRFPWLFVNLITAIAASAVIALFEDSIERLVALAVLMPIVASMAGNAGTQTLTIAVRAIATKELTGTNARRVLGKELIASAVNGLFFAIIVGVVSMLFYDNLYLSIVFGVAVIISLIIAAFAGAMIPIGLEKIGVDPAIASGVFLTTVTDISAFFIFLGLAAWLLI